GIHPQLQSVPSNDGGIIADGFHLAVRFEIPLSRIRGGEPVDEGAGDRRNPKERRFRALSARQTLAIEFVVKQGFQRVQQETPRGFGRESAMNRWSEPQSSLAEPGKS